MARSGVSSRRGADRLIASGVVEINGRPAEPSGSLIDPELDRVTVQGQLVAPAVGAHHYLVVNKPVGVIVSAGDPGHRRTVFDLIADEPGAPRLFSVGRLDMDSSGLILLTDDGPLAHKLAHPRHKLAKEYLARIVGLPSERELRQLREGVMLEGRPTLPAEVELASSPPGQVWIKLVLREGRNRQIRRMLDQVGHPVKELSRVAFGPIRLGRLKNGAWRRLRPAELSAL
ncbi:MAG: pseudouridine synthase, partial [Candidatus Dormibacteraceae bacterium]